MPYGAGRAGRFGAFRGGCGGDVRPGGQTLPRTGKEAVEAQKTFCEEAIAAANESKEKLLY